MATCSRGALAAPLVLLLLLPAPALAQQGAIAGTVQDAATGAVLPGVTVEVRATGAALIGHMRTAVTEANGQYRILALPVGTYDIRFSLPGFSTVQRERIIVSAGATATVNAAMTVGEPVQTVVIIERAPPLDVTSARQVMAFEGHEIRDLPTARNLSSLMVLVPALRYSNSAVGREPGGVCVGGAGTWCRPNVGGFNAHSGDDPADLAQGQVRLDGMLLNSGSATTLGILNGYVADVAHAQAVTFNLAGALGESETGGASIAIVPASGGNVYRGTYHTTYTTQRWFARNDRSPAGGVRNRIRYDYDVAGSVGGLILRNRVWFYSVLRGQGKEQQPGGPAFYYNRNAGIWAAPYQPDRTRGPVTYTNAWRTANLRLTLQATSRNRFTVFWDEQESCLDPCRGTISSTWSPEANWSVRAYPNRLWQLSWINPFTNRVFLEGGLHVMAQHLDFSRHKYERSHPDIPALSEAPTSGCCVGRDEVAPQVHGAIGASHPTTFGTGGCFSSGTLCSGALGQSSLERIGHARPRLSVSHVARSHITKVGWETQVFWQKQQIEVNAPQLLYNMTSPAAGCYNAAIPAASDCGTPHPMFAASDPFNSERRPQPVSVIMNAGSRSLDDRLTTHAAYVQHQWDVRPLTISSAVRYDHARSHYLPACLGPNVFVSDARAWCTERSDGVRLHDVSPRVGVAWDVFADGRTAVRGNIGRYLQAAGFTGMYAAANPARNAVTSIRRSWSDLDGDRIVDCDLLDPAPQFPTPAGTGDLCGAANARDLARFGSKPSLASGRTFFCGLQPGAHDVPEEAALAAAVDYCQRADGDVHQGWGVRRHEWQLGLGIERLILPAASAGVTYNHRWVRNQLVDDTLNVGCDLYTGVTAQCQADLLRFAAPIDPLEGVEQYSFYRAQAPIDPRLPGGGGYWIQGLNTRGTVSPLPSAPTVVSRQTYRAGWKGIDTHVVLRARGGLRLHGGTSTGAPFSNTCAVMVNAPASETRRLEGRPPQCALNTPWQTYVRGSVTYTVPGVDVLASAVFQSLPGPPIEARMTYRIMPTAPGNQPLIVWEQGHEWRATNTITCPTGNPAARIGCFMGSSETTVTVDLLERGAMYGSRYSLVDLKLAKNIRFGPRRVGVGADIYNLFNSDAITRYNPNYNPQTWVDEDGIEHTGNPWRSPAQLIRPRFARVALQIDF